MIQRSYQKPSQQPKQDQKPGKPIKITPPIGLSNLNQDDDNLQLRPKSLSQYIGQAKMIRQLSLIIESAKIRKTLPEHLLFYGQPGLGKTTIASLIASELNVPFKIVSAPGLQKIGDIVSLLLNLEEGSVLFIDEIHRLKAPLEETLYTAMEDKQVDLVMGKGHGTTSARLDLNSFVLVGATTQLGKLSKPLKDRFPSIFQLEPYSDTEILEVVERTSQVLKIKIEDKAKLLVARRSRGVPRITNNILKRFLDLQVVHKTKQITYSDALDFVDELGLFEHGLTKADIGYLKALQEGSLGLKTLSGILLEEKETLEIVIEPYLIHLGFVAKDSSGRKLTPKGQRFLDTH